MLQLLFVNVAMDRSMKKSAYSADWAGAAAETASQPKHPTQPVPTSPLAI